MQMRAMLSNDVYGDINSCRVGTVLLLVHIYKFKKPNFGLVKAVKIVIKNRSVSPWYSTLSIPKKYLIR